MQQKRKKPEKILTEVELELMNLIWGLSESTVTVKEVQLALPKGRDLAYTSVATIMKILEQKGFLESRKSERAHIYLPTLSRSDYEGTSLRHLADNLFHGNPKSMVMRLLDDSDLSKSEIEKIRKMLEGESRS